MSRRGENELREKILRADAAYAPFPEFTEWVAQAVDLAPWETALLEFETERQRASPDSLRRALDFAVRAAAIDTGAIEGLYRVDRSFTFSVAAQTATWEGDVAEKGPHVRPLFEAQLAGLELVMDAVSTRAAISEAWIRRLHEVLCEAQETYRVRTAVGAQEHPFPRGVYKTHSNHVERADGTTHSYCPVERTGDEMHRLTLEIASAEFAGAHPIVQAAYAHYAFVVIHPFADGNGRVARALASVFTFRACSLPLAILADQKAVYLDALAAADEGRFDRFIGFVLQSMVDTTSEITLRLREAGSDSVCESAERLSAAYRPRAPLSAAQMDAVAARIAGLVRDQLARELESAPLPAAIEASVVIDRRAVPANSRHEFRAVPDGAASIQAVVRSSDPDAHVSWKYQVVVNLDRDAFHAMQVEQTGSPEVPDGALRIRLDLVHPSLMTAFRTQLEPWVRIQAGALLREVHRRIEAAALRSARS